jgi:hypothetical protein
MKIYPNEDLLSITDRHQCYHSFAMVLKPLGFIGGAVGPILCSKINGKNKDLPGQLDKNQ